MNFVEASTWQPESRSVISLRDVTLCHGENIIQRRLSFDVRRGSVFAIMGTSGAGKSTVLRSMVGLLAPRNGAMIVGEDQTIQAFMRRGETVITRVKEVV